MLMGERTSPCPVAPDELLMRRVPAGTTFFQPNRPADSPMGPTWQAFKPRDDETTGISLSRMKSDKHPEFLDIDGFAARACRGKPPDKHLFIAVVRASQLINPPLSLEVRADPIDTENDHDLGHVLLPYLNSSLPKPDRNTLTLTLAREQVVRVVGPFNCDGRVEKYFVDWRRG